MQSRVYKAGVHIPSKVGPRAGWFFISFLSTLLSPLSPANSEDLSAQVSCLAEAVYFEARSETFLGQLAVAGVVLERVERSEFPNTVCGVVHYGHYLNGLPIKNRCAFSYWCDGLPEQVSDEGAWYEAIYVAELVLDGVRVANTDKATHYHASYVMPKWASDYTFMAQIGVHLFYGD
tara:strand:- start:4440 stop:4970 length:531 start_codon:yes stop_codon:yes gene_type:complete